MNIGQRIKALRGKTSQKDYANRYSIALNTLRNYESGERTPNVEFLCDLAEATGVSIQWLVTGQNLPEQGGGPDEGVPHQLDPAEELFQERVLVRNLINENRQLWKENGELKVKIGELNVQNIKLEGERNTARQQAKEYYERLKARAAPKKEDSDGLRQSA